MADRLLEIDDATFSANFGRAPFAVRQSLTDHPLLTLDAIADLADSLPPQSIERHAANQPKVLPGGAPVLEGRPGDIIRNIDHNGAWIVLWYIEQHPSYNQLLNNCLDAAEPFVVRSEGAMRKREGFLFMSAPGAVTPVHFDPEHNFLLQIRGTKTMNVCPFPNRETEHRELERYFSGGHRNLDAMPEQRAFSFTMQPGDGVYVPSFMPHWVQNGQAAGSISLSITFRTKSSERVEDVYAFNARLRRYHLKPRLVGTSPLIDLAKARLQNSWARARGLSSGKRG